jgi:hypothetical protein
VAERHPVVGGVDERLAELGVELRDVDRGDLGPIVGSGVYRIVVA